MFKGSLLLSWLCLSLFFFGGFARLRIVEDFFIPVDPIDPTDVTVVTQLSYDRLYRLRTMVHNWKGPVSAAIYIPKGEEEVGLQEIEELWDSTTIMRKWTSIHLVIEESDPLRSSEEDEASVDVLCKYPINILRNVALDNSRSNYVFLLDVDFVPSVPMNVIRNSYSRELAMSHHKMVFVVPAFDVVLNDTDIPPKTKREVRTLVDKKAAQIFRIRVCPRCHKYSNYDTWFQSKETYGIQYSVFYEPYIIAYLPDIPRYDERFFGWGANKQSHLYEAHAAGFAYAVLPEPFVFHVSHKYNFAEGDYKECRLRNIKRWKRFVKDVHDTYGHKCQQNETFPEHSWESLSSQFPDLSLSPSPLYARSARSPSARTPSRPSPPSFFDFPSPFVSVPLAMILSCGAVQIMMCVRNWWFRRPGTKRRRLSSTERWGFSDFEEKGVKLI